jgi:hypothetical protein
LTLPHRVESGRLLACLGLEDPGDDGVDLAGLDRAAIAPRQEAGEDLAEVGLVDRPRFAVKEELRRPRGGQSAIGRRSPATRSRARDRLEVDLGLKT